MCAEHLPGPAGEIQQCDDFGYVLELWRLGTSAQATALLCDDSSSSHLDKEFCDLLLRFLTGRNKQVTATELFSILQASDSNLTGKFIFGFMVVDCINKFSLDEALQFCEKVSLLPKFLCTIAEAALVVKVQTILNSVFDPCIENFPPLLRRRVSLSLHAICKSETEFLEKQKCDVTTRTVIENCFTMFECFCDLIEADMSTNKTILIDASVGDYEKYLVWRDLAQRYVRDIATPDSRYSPFQLLIIGKLDCGLCLVTVAHTVIDGETKPINFMKRLVWGHVPMIQRPQTISASLEDIENAKKILLYNHFLCASIIFTDGLCEIFMCLGMKDKLERAFVHNIKMLQSVPASLTIHHVKTAIFLRNNDIICNISEKTAEWLSDFDWIQVFTGCTSSADDVIYLLDLPALNVEEIEIYKLLLRWSYNAANETYYGDLLAQKFNEKVNEQFVKVKRVLRLSRLATHKNEVLFQQYISLSELREFGRPKDHGIGDTGEYHGFPGRYTTSKENEWRALLDGGCEKPDTSRYRINLPILSDEDHVMINNAFGSGGESDELGYITREDVERLQPNGWLNDKIISSYLTMIQARSNTKNIQGVCLPKIFSFDTFFYPKLTTCGYSSLMNWHKNVDLVKQDFLFIPVNEKLHWRLVCVDVKNKRIQLYDSLNNKNQKCLEVVEEMMCTVGANARIYASWTREVVANIPLQQNKDDCGVFLCKYADYISRGGCIEFFESKDILHFRKCILLELIKKELMC